MRSDDDDDDEDPKLPHDVAVEILKRLPVECLLRCRCVCRSWRSAIDDPRFAALHLTHSALDASNWYLVCLDRWNTSRCLFSLLSQESLTLPSRSRIEVPSVTPAGRYDFVGSCNGLICVAAISRDGFSQTMYLWNLFTGKHKAVPRSGLGHQFSSMETAYESLGFGFDAGSNDYKIVRILCFEVDSGPKPRVEIYSLSTDSWRSLECEVPVFCDNGPAVFLNGNLHWVAVKFDDAWNEGKYGSIVSFDVAGEVFDDMALPEEILHMDNGDLIASVAVLNDLLAVFINIMDAVMHPESHSICSVWVMREYRVPESWTKLYSFEAPGLVTGFDGFTRNGELLMELDDEERVSWDPITGQSANLPLSTQCKLVTIIESLVSPYR